MDIEGCAEEIERLYRLIDAMDGRVKMLENASRDKLKQSVDDQIMDLMRGARLWMTSRTVADNLDMPISTISGAMDRLYEKGSLIKKGEQKGTSYMVSIGEKD